MKILCTFPGQFGDILWSLPTARVITEMKENFSFEEAENNKAKVDFGIMPSFRSLLPLLNVQSYIDKAFVIEDWIEVGRPYGCQPWEAPVQEGYDKVYHLGYRYHPTRDNPLIDFIAGQQGIVLKDPIPFLSLPSTLADLASALKLEKDIYVSYAFNNSMLESKMSILNGIKARLPELNFVDVSKDSWLDAAHIIKHSIAFIGCRSSNYVLACGLGKKVFVIEPNIARSKYGLWGTTFTCPYANEKEVLHPIEIIDELKSRLVEVIQ